MNSELITAINLLEKEKGISKDVIFDAIEQSFLAASSKLFGKNENVKVVMDRETGDYHLYQELEVVRDEDFVDKETQITKSELKEKYDVSLKYGEVFQKEFKANDFGRIASQSAKSVILQKIREEEHRSIYEKYVEKKHQVITGTVSRRTAKGVTVNIGTTEAYLGELDQVKSENYYVGSRIKVYIKDVTDTKRGLRVVASRTVPDFVKKLFEAEVAEIQNGIVEIKSIAREPGSRTKIAVHSNDPEVEPIGACVGLNGTRVNAVVDELGGEKIDIIEWNENPAQFIENAISPARVIVVATDDEEQSAIVIVSDDQLSLAIGRVGQNARLVAKLTGYKIDIKSESEALEQGIFDQLGYDYEAYKEAEAEAEPEEEIEYEYVEVEDDDENEDDEDVEYEYVEVEVDEDGNEIEYVEESEEEDE